MAGFDWESHGCALNIIALVALLLVGSCVVDKTKEIFAKMEEEREEAQRKQKEEELWREAESQRQEEQRRKDDREQRLQNFVLKEAPKLWNAYQQLQSEIKEQDGRLQKLKDTLEEFGKDAETDEDYQRIASMRDEMRRTLQTMRTKMEDAYLAAMKFEATPGRKDYAETMRRALEDGIQEADSSAQRYHDMSQSK